MVQHQAQVALIGWRALLTSMGVVVMLLVAISHQSNVPLVEESHRHLSASEPEAIPFTSYHTSKQALQYILVFIMVLLAAHPLGVLCPQYLKLPLITGYLLVGIVAGPFITNLLPIELIKMLAPCVNALALSFISFQAGQEIYLPELRPQLKGILQLLTMMYGVTMTLMTGILVATSHFFFFSPFKSTCQLAMALMFGSIAVLGSPATALAIKIELNSVGPFTSLMLGATMMAEFVVLVSFSISRVLTSVYCAEIHLTFGNLVFILTIVLSNLFVGAGLAFLIIALFCIPGGAHNAVDSQVLGDQQYVHPDCPSPPQRSFHPNLSSIHEHVQLKDHAIDLNHSETRHHTYQDMDDTMSLHSQTSLLAIVGSLQFKGFFWLLLGFAFYLLTSTIAETTVAVYGMTWEVKFEPLLVLMTASCIAGHYNGIRHDMHVILDTAAPYLFLPFFVMTGAALKLDQVVQAIPLMSCYVIVRFLSIFIACYVGGRWILMLQPREYNNLWLTMTPQAGVALGLANEIKGLSSEPWAAEFAATIVAAVVVNQIIGPVLCAMGLIRAGESHVVKDEPVPIATSDDNPPLDPRPLLPFYKVEQAVVIGHDSLAFEVALELSLYGAHVAVPLLEEELAEKWQDVNQTLLDRCANGDLITYKNTLHKRPYVEDSVMSDIPMLQNQHDGISSSTDVVIFTGNPTDTLERVKNIRSTLASCPRLIAFVPDTQYAKALKDEGVLLIQPAIAMANIATRMALLEYELAQQLSSELSTTSLYSTADYILHHAYPSDIKVSSRGLGLGRSVVNHRTVNYEQLSNTLASLNQPLPPPPPRVSMFGTTARGHDPFKHSRTGSVYEYYTLDEGKDQGVFRDQYLPSPKSNRGLSQRKMQQRISRTNSIESHSAYGPRLHRSHSTGE